MCKARDSRKAEAGITAKGASTKHQEKEGDFHNLRKYLANYFVNK